VGMNPLLAYIFPDFWGALTGSWGQKLCWPYHHAGGIPGLMNAVVMTLFMAFLTALALRMGVRLKF